MSWTEEQKFADRILQTTLSEGWQDLINYINKRVEILKAKVIMSEEPMLKEKHEAQTWTMFLKQVESWKDIAIRARSEKNG